jgi:hypothetical protein
MVKPNNGRGKSARRGQTRSPYSLKWYQARITSWDYSWSFRMATRREVLSGDDAIQEFAILTFKGTVAYPEEFKYPEIEIQLVESTTLIQNETVTPSIGSMSANGRLLSVYVSVPVERIKTLVSVAPRVLVVDFHAFPLHYRRALVVSIQLDTEIE